MTQFPQTITKQNGGADVMAIGLVLLQTISTYVTAAELPLELRAGLAEIVETNQGNEPGLRTRQYHWARHGAQQHRCHCRHIEQMRKERVAVLAGARSAKGRFRPEVCRERQTCSKATDGQDVDASASKNLQTSPTKCHECIPENSLQSAPWNRLKAMRLLHGFHGFVI